MELIYSMRRKPLKCEPPHFESPTDREVVRPICTISTCNIIAFSSPTELGDAEGDTWGGHVYVCDLETPWDSHKVASMAHPVSTLEWDIEGRHLLVGTVEGEVSVYAQKDHLLNEWQCLYTYNFPGEHIIKAAFFHNGRRVVALDKKLDAPITERLQMTRSTPTLKGFGGVAVEGACVVTGSGLVGALVARGAGALAATDSLRHARDRVVSAAIAHKNGNLIISAWCVSSSSAHVRTSVCSVRGAGSAPAELTLQPLPALPLVDSNPVSLTWCLREDTDTLLVAGTKLTLWKLTERSHPLHKLLSKGPMQGSTTPGGGQKQAADCFNTVVWQQMAAWPIENGHAVQVCSGKSPLCARAALATPAHVTLLDTETQLHICTRPVITSGSGASSPPTAGTPPKKAKYGPGVLPPGSSCAIVSCVELSQMGCVLVCIDSHAQLHVYRMPQPWVDIPSGVSAQLAAATLECGAVCGYDCLDVLLTLKPNVVEAVYERFTENFQRQPPAFQQFYYHSWLKLRIALCRLVPSGQTAASWLACLQSCLGGWAASGAAVRPDERPDAAPLAALVASEHAHDQEKALLTLEARTEPSSEALNLQPLRRILQRALDTALTALCAKHSNQTQYSLISDPTAVTLLRKLVVLARACGRGGDVLSRALARVAQSGKHDQNEECLLLAAQLSAPRVWEALPRCCVSYNGGRGWPLYFEYGVEPEALRCAPEPPNFAQGDTINPSTHMDAIRYMYLGGGGRPAHWRQCSRCGSRSLPAAQPARHPLQRAYDARFLLACRCGGKWTLFSNV
ncbi:mediator of RNA polymerase II transcription subunit 16 [Amyelois transitella]|uniref:mediator of RNA polymerase II transcription subunit 16 n=1 Tax=Amyelois transitella TaxID=680683 RepID=UPI0029907B2A|nr:mediator of RNA polymerase II transcription subunit 16 [Amyelois transitella]